LSPSRNGQIGVVTRFGEHHETEVNMVHIGNLGFMATRGKKSAGTEKGPYVTYDLINFAFLAHAVLTTDDVVKAMK